MLPLLVAIPLVAAVLAVFVDRDDPRVRGALIACVAGAMGVTLLALVPPEWLPWRSLSELGAGRGELELGVGGWVASTYAARWVPTLGVDLAGVLRATDVLVMVALVLALVGAGARRGPGAMGGTSSGATGGTMPRGSARAPRRSWELAARFGLVAAATGALSTTDAGVRAWCVGFAWVACAVELGAVSHGARRASWGGEGLAWGLVVIAATWAAALQAAASGHAAFSPPIAADAAALLTSPSAVSGATILAASMIAAMLAMGVFPLRRWPWIDGEREDPRGELLRDVAGWAIGLAVLRAGMAAAPGASAAATNLVAWLVSGSLVVVALGFTGSTDPRARRRVFSGFASTLLFALVAMPSRATWSVVGFVAVTCTLAGLALLTEPDHERHGSTTSASRDALAGAEAAAQRGGWLAAAILALPFGPGLVAWMVLGRGVSAAPPIGIAALPLAPLAVSALWIATSLAILTCLVSLLSPPARASARRDEGEDAERRIRDDALASGWGVHLVTAVLAVLLAGTGQRVLGATDAEAERAFARWAHGRCQDEAARRVGKDARSRQRSSSVEGEGVDLPRAAPEETCGPAPEEADAARLLERRDRGRIDGPLSRAVIRIREEVGE